MISYFDLPQYNPWWTSPSSIEKDPQIRRYLESSINWDPDILKYLRVEDDGYIFYSLRGPRQVGKTTSVKLIIKRLIDGGTNPLSILYYPCDQVEDDKEFKELISLFIGRKPHSEFDKKYIFLDEAASVKNWQRAIKVLADNGSLDDVTLVVNGSHSLDVKEGATYLVGRTGGDPDCHKIFVPMKFAEFVRCVDGGLWEQMRTMGLGTGEERRRTLSALFRGGDLPDGLPLLKRELDELLDSYMVCGGIPNAIDEYRTTNDIRNATFNLYQNGFRSDMAVRGRDNETARALVSALVKRASMEFTWDKLGKDMGIRYCPTVKEYFEMMEGCFVVTHIHMTDDHMRPKRLTNKAKKLYFQDPFIFHALRAWVEPDIDGTPMDMINRHLSDETNRGHIIEGIVANHLIRLSFNMNPGPQFNYDRNLFYYKGGKGKGRRDSEVDFLLYLGGDMFPLEVKYQSSITKRDASLVRALGTEHEVRGMVVTKDLWEVTDDCIMLPASLFCTMI